MKKTHVLFFDPDRSRFERFKPQSEDSEYFFHYIQSLEEGRESFKTESDWRVLVMNASFLAREDVYQWVRSCKEQSASFRLIFLGHDGSKTEILRALRLEASDYLDASVTDFDFNQALKKVASPGVSSQSKHHPMIDGTPMSSGAQRPELRLVENVMSLEAAGSSPLGSSSANAEGILEVERARLSFTALKKRWAESFEREYLTELLSKKQGNVSAAAREAKLDRSNFLRLLRKHGLKAEVYRRPAMAA